MSKQKRERGGEREALIDNESDSIFFRSKYKIFVDFSVVQTAAMTASVSQTIACIIIIVLPFVVFLLIFAPPFARYLRLSYVTRHQFLEEKKWLCLSEKYFCWSPIWYRLFDIFKNALISMCVCRNLFVYLHLCCPIQIVWHCLYGSAVTMRKSNLRIFALGTIQS